MIKDAPLLRKEGLGVVTKLLFMQKTNKMSGGLFPKWMPSAQ